MVYHQVAISDLAPVAIRGLLPVGHCLNPLKKHQWYGQLLPSPTPQPGYLAASTNIHRADMKRLKPYEGWMLWQPPPLLAPWQIRQ